MAFSDGGVKGREITLKIDGATVAGVQSKGITINNEPVDVSADDSSGWRQLLSTAGSTSVDATLSGVTRDSDLIQSALAAGKTFDLVFTYPDGSGVSLTGFLASYAVTGEYNGAETFDASYQSTGEVTYTAAT